MVRDLELREQSRRYIDTFEYWTRRLINEEMMERYGFHYFYHKHESGEWLIPPKMAGRAEQALMTNSQYQRRVDALSREDLVYLLTEENLFETMFKPALAYHYLAKEPALEALNQYVELCNNAEDTTKPFREEDAARLVEMTEKFIDGYKVYYNKKNQQVFYNAPTILRIADSMGYSHIRTYSDDWFISLLDGEFQYEGDIPYKVWAEMDPTFNPDRYNVEWELFLNGRFLTRGEGTEIEFPDGDFAPGATIKVVFRVTAKKTLRRRGNYDDQAEMNFIWR